MTADVPAAEAMDVDKPEPSGKSSGEGEARTEPAASDGQNLVDALRQLEDDPSSEEDEDLAAGGGKKKVLVGGEGADFVAAELGRNPDVADAIKRIQDQGALKTAGIDRESDAEPLLGLLGQLGMTRAEVYRHTLDDALKELRDRIEAMPQGTLLSLLDASFPYIGIEELKAIPLAALEHLKPVPSSYLKQISRNVELFRQLPVEVQRQCWELRAELLRRHTAPALTAYAEETATTMRNLDQDLALAPLDVNDGFAVYIPGTAPSSTEKGDRGHAKPHVPGLPRASLRRASASVQRLKRVVGDSKKLYLGVVMNCRMHYAEHGGSGACSLRSQLLMSLHDDEKTGLCGVDRCHRLAWLADACVRDRCLDGRRCAEIMQIIEKINFDSKAGERAARAKATGSKKKATPPAPARKMATRSAPPKLPTLKFTFGKKKEEDAKEPTATEPAAKEPAAEPAAAPAEPSVGGGNTDVGAPGPTASDADDGVSDAPAGSVVADLSNASGENLLGDAAMCLRDPPVLHLLLHETLRTLDAALEKNKNAKKIEPLSKNARLEELTRLVTLALAARRILRDRSPSFPEVPADLMDRFYPLLGDVIASGGFLGDTIDDEGNAGDPGEVPSDEEGEVPEDMELAEVEETNEDGEIVVVKKWRPRSKPAFRIKINVKSAKKASVKQQIAELSEMMKASDAARKIALTHALRRLREGDVAGANPILAAAAAGGLPDSCVGDEQPFAITLARRLAAMNSGMGAVEAAAPGGALWRNAVDGCLLRCCVAGLEVHEETLRLVLAASARMTSEDLCAVVEATLHVTRKSRKVNKRRAKPIVYEYEPIKPVKGVIAGRRGLGGVGGGGSFGPGLGGSSGDLGGYASASSAGLGGYTSGGTDAGSDGAPGGGGGADGVQATYQLLVRRESARLTEAAAPKLHEYLARKDRRDMRRSGRAGGVGDEDDAGRPFSP
jgi:hypothetical protein